LQSLNLEDTQGTAAGVTELRKALPGCKISFFSTKRSPGQRD